MSFAGMVSWRATGFPSLSSDMMSRVFVSNDLNSSASSERRWLHSHRLWVKYEKSPFRSLLFRHLMSSLSSTMIGRIKAWRRRVAFPRSLIAMFFSLRSKSFMIYYIKLCSFYQHIWQFISTPKRLESSCRFPDKLSILQKKSYSYTLLKENILDDSRLL